MLRARGRCLKRGLEVRCRRRDVEVRRYGGTEVWRHVVGPGTLPQKRSGDALQACRCGGICLKSPGALEARCRRRDVEVFASRALELRRYAVGVEMRRYGGMETGCKRADVVT